MSDLRLPLPREQQNECNRVILCGSRSKSSSGRAAGARPLGDTLGLGAFIYGSTRPTVPISVTSANISPNCLPALFAEILQRNLDALVVHLLEISLERLTALGAAMEELNDVRNRCAFLPINGFDLCL